MNRAKAYFYVSEQPDEEDSSPLVFINESGQVSEAIQQCRISQLPEIVGECPLTLIIPDRLVTLHKVTLPLLNDKKTRAAIPYAIEDYSAQDVSSLHFAYDRKFYENGQYLVLSCDKDWFQNLITLLQKNQLKPEHITTAWFALSDNQCVLFDQTMLCRSSLISGAIPFTMWPMIKEQFITTEEIGILQFEKTSNIPEELKDKLTKSEYNWESWAAEQLNRSTYISLDQGPFAAHKKDTSLKQPMWLIGGSITIWLVIWLITNLLSLHHTNQAIKQIDGKIATIYRQFFPGAKQVISPKFRISQKLKGQINSSESGLLRLLDQLAVPLQTNQVTPVQLSYQNQRLTLKLIANNFSQLEKFMAALKNQSIKARQLDANRNENKVEATVEMQL